MNRTPRGTKWERKKSRIKFVYRNQKITVERVGGNPFKTRTRDSIRGFKLLN